MHFLNNEHSSSRIYQLVLFCSVLLLVLTALTQKQFVDVRGRKDILII